MMLLNDSEPKRCDPDPGIFSVSLISLSSLLRGLPLFFCARPRTPLRVLCVMAFDTLHVCRHSQRLPAHRLKTLATLLDLGACANSLYDAKDFCPKEYATTLRLLGDAGIRSSVDEYLIRLQELESRRPRPGGGYGQSRRIRSYREAVVRLSLGIVATTALGKRSVEEGVRATHGNSDLEILFRIAMQCQIIDDVLDYSRDASAGLPSFLTAPASLPEACELACSAALEYSSTSDLLLSGAGWPFRIGLFGVSVCAKLAIGLLRWRHRLVSPRKTAPAPFHSGSGGP